MHHKPTHRPSHFAIVMVFAWFLGGCAAVDLPSTRASAIVLDSGWQLQDIAKVPQDGREISQANYSPAAWHKATVPGTVLTSLVNEGIYPEPLYGENNRPNIIPESLCRTSYWYRTQFTVPRDYSGKHIRLNFDGINYMADVWVNGQQVGEIRGAFARGIFDVTSVVKPGEAAAVAVLIKPPLNPGEPIEQTVQNGMGLNGGIMSRDGPTFICTQGWDWIPAIRDRAMGIWQKVTLSATGPVIIKDPYVVTDLPLPRTDSAAVAIEATVQNISKTHAIGTLTGKLGEITIPPTPLSLGAGASSTVKLVLNIGNPKLWWPNGFGDPNLYPLDLNFEIGGAISDRRELNVGIREIEFAVPNSENLTIVVNGVPVYAKGGNWGMDEAMKRSPRHRLEAQIRLHREANYTMIRNWVGQSTGEDFYDLCDRYGLLVWDEFFQPNPTDSGRNAGRGRGPTTTSRAIGDEDISDVPLYLANVREKVLRFRNHPSIALWCGRNEGVPTPASINDGNAAILKELDPARLYQPSSTAGRGVRSGGPYAWRPPVAFYSGSGFGAGRGRGRGATSTTVAAGLFANVSLEPFKTEIGSASIPTLESIKSFLPEKDWNPVPLNDAWASHDLTRGNGRGDQYPQALAERYGPFTNLPEFVRKAQLANYEAFRAMYEGRLAKMFNPSTATLIWMSNPAQPSFTWQIYSYDLEPFASFFGTKKACEPVHIQMNQNDFHVMVINNTPGQLDGLRASVRVFNLEGSLKHERQIPVSAKPSMATDLGAIEFPQDVSPVHFVKVELRDTRDRLISDNFYWRAHPDRPDDYTDLDKLPLVTLNAEVARRGEGGKNLLDVKLSNPSQSIALMTHIQLRNARTKQRILPVYYSDNYVSLLPGESRTITVESEGLEKISPLIVLDGWNVTTRSRSFPEAEVAPNTDALVNLAR